MNSSIQRHFRFLSTVLSFNGQYAPREAAFRADDDDSEAINLCFKQLTIVLFGGFALSGWRCVCLGRSGVLGRRRLVGDGPCVGAVHVRRLHVRRQGGGLEGARFFVGVERIRSLSVRSSRDVDVSC